MPVVGVALKSRKPPEGNFAPGKYEIRTFWLVQTDSINDGPITAASAPGLPIIGTTYVWGNESNIEMRARHYEPRPLGDAPLRVWEVAVVYSTPDTKEYGRGEQARGAGPGTGKESDAEFANPLLELPSAKIHFHSREVLITQLYDTITGTLKPATASNGEVFDPPPKRLQNYMTLEITRNEPITAPHPALGDTYGNAVNADPFWGLPAGKWKVKEINPESQNRQLPGGTVFPFLRVTYAFDSNPDGWDLQMLDYGTYTWQQPPAPPNAPAKRTDILTDKSHPTAAPLDGAGNVLPDRCKWVVNPGTANASGGLLTYRTTPLTVFQDKMLVQVSSTGGDLPAFNIDGGATQVMQQNATFKAFGVGNQPAPYGQTFILLTADNKVVNLLGPGTGTLWIWCPAVFFAIRPYNYLRYANLGLPQNFAQCQ